VLQQISDRAADGADEQYRDHPRGPAPALCVGVAVEEAVERPNQAADPGHRMADDAQQRLRITESEFDQHG
jgi:hypothetical protein